MTAGNTEIGLKLFGSDRDPDLCKGVTVAHFQELGISHDCKERLNTIRSTGRQEHVHQLSGNEYGCL